MTVDRDALEAALGAHRWVEHPALPGRTNHKRAGVLVPLRWRAGRPHTLLTLRPTRMNRHGGEVSFPGGKPEVGDADLWHTARREAHEELGIMEPVPLGRLSSMPVYTSNFRLEPFVARVDHEALVPDPGEVAAVLEVDLLEHLRRDATESVREAGWEMPVYRVDGLVIFGATALTLAELLGVVAGVMGTEVPGLRDGGLRVKDLFDRGALAGR